MAKLPCDQYILIYGCPDGEGHWSNIANQSVAQVIRQKGAFDATFMSFVTKSIRSAEQRLVLVDVGGRRSTQNENIFRECEGYVILSSSPEEIPAWREFGDGLGLKCLAELDSRLSDEESVVYPDQGDGVLRGLVVGLERGTFVCSAVINALAEKLKEIIATNSQMTLAEEQADISGIQLADQIGIEDRTDPFLGYRPWHLAPALKAVKRFCTKPLIRIWNIRSFWTAAAMVIAFRKSVVELFDVSNGYIAIPDLKPKKNGSPLGLDWKTSEFDDFTIVNFRIQGDIFNISALHTIYPPAVNKTKGVIISGRGPIVLAATIGRAYGNAKHPFIAMFAAAESGREQASLQGQKWDEIHPGCGPCVEIAGKNIGRLIPVAAEDLKF
ncbi:MAG: CRISPR-associated protein Csx3 [Patescibacteria group bacterium]